jgi:hypothetical protein
MTTLVCDELQTTLTQTVNLVYDRVYHIAGLKIKLLMYNNPTGTFTLSLKSGSDVLASAAFTSADIKTDLSTTDNYAHLYKALNFSLPLKKGSYDLVLSSSGYTFSTSSFLGWCKSYENVFNEEVDSAVPYSDKPFDYLVYANVREDLIK